jgi:hypothetical protein
MKPGPIERANRELDQELDRKVKRAPKRLELEVMLRHTAVDLLSAARTLQIYYERISAQEGEPQLATPVWSHWAAQAFEAFEILGIDVATFSSARELRPWVGEWSPGGFSKDAGKLAVGAP